MRENHIILFLYQTKYYIPLIYEHQLKGGYNPLALQASTGRKQQLPDLQAPT